MPKTRAVAKPALARETWRLLFDFFISTRAQRDEALENLGLTPNDARALSTLGSADGIAMRVLADAWGTDASNATLIVDRLERIGLAVRRGVPEDRRVKLVVLTSRGQRAKRRLAKALYEPPGELLGLTEKQLVGLRDALEEITSARKH